jgi:hypothetical protein
MKKILLGLTFTSALLGVVLIPDTAQNRCYDNSNIIKCNDKNSNFYGQDGDFIINKPNYIDNRDGTITDNVTKLMWSKRVDSKKISLEDALIDAKYMTLGGYDDWRVPTIKELYSLIDFRGYTGFTRGDKSMTTVPSNAIPYINTNYFEFKYGASNERYIDAQWLSSTKYVSTTMNNMQTLFGVNFADGRIKGYGYKKANSFFNKKKFYVRYVRGTTQYGKNDFVDNKNQTLTDKSTNLTWTKQDSKEPMSWEEALEYAKNLRVGGYDDWRVPSAKELQYIVNYSKSPDTTYSPAIDDKFSLTAIRNEAGQKDFGYYWTSTTHQDGPRQYSNAAYISFGRALGKMRGEVMDVHGAGAQRSDPKTGSKKFHGPQGDAVRSSNYVICVRGGNIQKNTQENIQEQYINRQNITRDKSSTQRDRKRKRPSFVKRLDRDGDNRVSRDEFDGPARAFDFHDENQDGFLSEQEAPKGPPPRDQKGRF